MKLNVKQRAMLPLALSSSTWRILVGNSGLKSPAAAKAMARAVEGATES